MWCRYYSSLSHGFTHARAPGTLRRCPVRLDREFLSSRDTFQVSPLFQVRNSLLPRQHLACAGPPLPLSPIRTVVRLPTARSRQVELEADGNIFFLQLDERSVDDGQNWSWTINAIARRFGLRSRPMSVQRGRLVLTCRRRSHRLEPSGCMTTAQPPCAHHVGSRQLLLPGSPR